MVRARILADPVDDRVLAALIDLVEEQGFPGLRLDALLGRADVDRADFEARYGGLEGCVLRLYEGLSGVFRGTVRRAYESEEFWRDGLRSAAYAAATWITAHPRETRFGVVEVLQAEGEMLRVRREEIFHFCVDLLDSARCEAVEPDAIPASAPVVVIGSIAEMLTRAITRERPIEAVAAVPQLMYLALRPYVGEESARVELSIPPPAPSAKHRRV